MGNSASDTGLTGACNAPGEDASSGEVNEQLLPQSGACVYMLTATASTKGLATTGSSHDRQTGREWNHITRKVEVVRHGHISPVIKELLLLFKKHFNSKPHTVWKTGSCSQSLEQLGIRALLKNLGFEPATF